MTTAVLVLVSTCHSSAYSRPQSYSHLHSCHLPPCVLNVKTLAAAFNQEKALVGAFSVITNLRMELFEALLDNILTSRLLSRTLVAGGRGGADRDYK